MPTSPLRPLAGAFACALLLAAVYACGGDDDASPAPAPSCLPGASIACTGPGGCAGGQICRADGKSYEPCDCGTPVSDAGAPPPVDAGQPDACGPSRVVFLNRKGGTYVPGGIPDARVNASPFALTPQSSPAWIVGNATWDEIVSCVAAKFAPFAIRVTDVDPVTSVEHTEVTFVQAGTPALNGQLVRGHFECRDVPNPIIFVSQAIATPSDQVCAVVVQQVAFALGLDYVAACPDAMTAGYVPCADAGFTNTEIACGIAPSPMPQPCACDQTKTSRNSYARMMQLVGPRCP